jgi:hypothetical protein
LSLFSTEQKQGDVKRGHIYKNLYQMVIGVFVHFSLISNNKQIIIQKNVEAIVT